MTLRDREQRVGDAPLGLMPPDGLAPRLANADTPYRAWAAVALLTADAPRHRAEGRRLATELADALPGISDLEHADLAGYALIDGAGFLPSVQQERLRGAVPLPHPQRGRRSKFYDSSVYVYLLARGTGSKLVWTSDLVRHIDEELSRLGESASPDLVEFALVVAARLELAGVAPIREETFRRLRGLVTGSPDSREGAVALRWLLELYGDRWPLGADAAALRQDVRVAAGRSASGYAPDADERLALAAMQLEVGTRRDPEFRLTTRADEFAVVARHLGWRRWSEGAAYLFGIAAFAGGPAIAAVKAGWFNPLVGWATALGWGVPAAVWAVLLVLGRPRDTMVLGTGVVAGITYASLALFAGWTHKATWMPSLAGEGALLSLFMAGVSSVVAGFKAGRQQQPTNPN